MLIGAKKQLISSVLGGSSCSWDPTNKHADITLSNGNLTYTSSTHDKTVKAIATHSAGKYYFECRHDSGTGVVVGLEGSAATLAEWVGNAVPGFGWQPTGDIILAGSGTIATINTHGAGEVMAIAIDLTAKLFWGKNLTAAGNWNNNSLANPDTGVGGVSVAALGSVTLFPAASCHLGAFCTANFGASAYAGIRPSGYRNW